jgi:hypothetical protein
MLSNVFAGSLLTDRSESVHGLLEESGGMGHCGRKEILVKGL